MLHFSFYSTTELVRDPVIDGDRAHLGSPPHSKYFNGKWVGESNIAFVVVKGLGLLSNPHKISRLPLPTPRLKDFLIKIGETSNYPQN